MAYSDTENSSDGEIFSEDDLEPDDLFNDESEEAVEDRKSGQEEEKKPEESKIIEKKKQTRVVKNPRVTLNFDSLRGSNGLSALKKLFKDFQFKGNGHEKEDLTRIMTVLQQWMCYQLCPSYNFESCMLQLENLGRKKVVQTLMKKYRLGIDDWGETPTEVTENVDKIEKVERSEFDLLLDEQIANARSDGEFSEEEMPSHPPKENQQSNQNQEVTLTPEQLERISRNRKLAEERRLKRMSAQCSSVDISPQSQQTNNSDIPEQITTDNSVIPEQITTDN